MAKTAPTKDIRAGTFGVLQVALVIVVESVLFKMIFNLGYSYPLECNFWERVGHQPLLRGQRQGRGPYGAQYHAHSTRDHLRVDHMIVCA